MAELFADSPLILDAVDWSIFGLPKRNGLDSTIWIGSAESYTPCHQDTYGYNLVCSSMWSKEMDSFSSKRIQ